MAKMGCPTKYNKRMSAKAREYLRTYKDIDEVIPSLAGLSLFMGIDKDTLYRWAEKYSDISGTLRDLKDIQERELLKGSLTGTYNSTIAKLILHKHDYSERKDIDVTSNGNTVDAVQREIMK